MHHRTALFALHLATLFFGLSGIFGKLALAAPLVIVFGRALFAGAALGVFTRLGEPPTVLSGRRRLALAAAVRQVIRSGLALLGVSAPDSM